MMKYIKVFDKIYLVGRGIWEYSRPLTGVGDSNIFLIDGGKEVALIDAGARFNLNKLIKNVSSLNKDFRKIRKVVITHNHLDHTDGLMDLRRKLKVKVYGGGRKLLQTKNR